MLLAAPAFAHRRGEDQNAKYWPPVAAHRQRLGRSQPVLQLRVGEWVEQETPWATAA